MTKELIREYIKKRRLLLPVEEAKIKSSRIVERARKLLPLKAETFMFYAPFNKEVNILALAEELISSGKRVAFPKVSGKSILPIEVSSLRELSPGYCSILEPSLNYSKVMRDVDIIFVPGIAFDTSCFRIGYGGGFYDRFLAEHNVGTKIGICFDFQIVEKIPHEPFDIPVDVVISEKREIRRNKWN